MIDNNFILQSLRTALNAGSHHTQQRLHFCLWLQKQFINVIF